MRRVFTGEAPPSLALARKQFWHTLFCLTLLVATASTISAQNPKAQSILDRYQEVRPSKEDLAMYQLDWATSLKHALSRAEEEDRPIFLIVIHAQYGDIHSGHC